MESSTNGIEVAAPPALVQRRRTRRAGTRVALLSLATLIVTCAVLNAGLVASPEISETNSKPYLLVASPDMPDPTFQQAVILMLPPTTLPLVAGIVINKPTKMTLGQLFSHSRAIGNQAQAVYFGGPVDLTSPVILMRTAQAPDSSTRLLENIYMSIDAGSITEILKRPDTGKDLRLFLGRAQWTVDQLRSEILRGSWIISPATPEIVFSADPAGVWPALEQRAKLREIKEEIGTSDQRFGFCSLWSIDSGAATPKHIDEYIERSE